MKLIHLSDLHIGKRVYGFSMIEDQRHILGQITEIIRDEKPDAVLIAGDIYDKPVPPAEAVQLFDDFISELASLQTEVLIISGNHDSAERLSFGSRIMDRSGLHFAGGYDGSTRKVTLEDEFGRVNIYMLPFIKPVHVRAAFPDDEGTQEISTYTDAVRFAIERMGVDTSERNVLVAHQFVTGSERCESEEISVGGLDNVDADVFEAFDYIALGHLHGPQDTRGARVRYSGSPLKYSFSESRQTKSLTIVEMYEKNDATVFNLRCPELEPLRDMRELKGRFDELINADPFNDGDHDDYIRVILTDEEDVIGAMQSLRTIYPNIMRLDYDNARSRAAQILPDSSDTDSRSPLEIFGTLYESMNGKPMDEDQEKLVAELIEKVWGDEA